jgi:wobble nucleotide-excising tRNase
MIKKILKIKNIGRLNIPVKDENGDENKNDDFSFKKNTLIFGENTYGKTTLVSVLKSLQSGGLLDNRKKFKSQNEIQIKIEIDDNGISKFHEYGKNSWRNDNILIFDSDFIKDHIFSEDQIKGEHLKSLPKVLIGDGIKQDIDQINSIIKCDNGCCDDCEFCLNTKLNLHKNTFNKNYQLNQFLETNTEILHVDKQIKEKENALLVDEKLSDLKMRSQGSDFYKLDFQTIENLFDKKINNIFESIIEKHLSEKTNNLEKSKWFLEYGLKLKKGNICPFCSQDTTNVQNFIDNLSSYFDKEYIDFKNEIENYSKTFLSFDLEKELLAFDKLSFASIKELIDKKNFESTPKETEEKKKNLNFGNALINVKNKIEKKRQDLNFDCNFKNDTDFIFLKDFFSKSKVILMEVINRQALTYQEKIKINIDLINLKLNKYRYSTEGIAFFEKYKQIENNLKVKNANKKIAQDNLKKKVDTIFKDNLQDINFFLKELRADFKITKLVPSVDNRDKNNYLKINEYSFEFIDIQRNFISVEIGNFKETFSDSDKRLLGFAFFLSILKNDTNLGNKIIVLDDPFSSFDINRKEETIRLFDSIKNIGNKEPVQKIVFTHEKNFYCQLNKLISSGDKKLLKLNFSIANNGTMIEKIDIKKFESDKYYSDLDYINDAICKNTNLDEALPKARECAEYLLKAKYINTLESYRSATGDPINFNINSINSFLEAIDQKCLVKDKLLELELHKFHHSQPQWKIDLSDTKKNQILEDFVKLIEQI